jgi:uncharacterized protein YjdB
MRRRHQLLLPVLFLAAACADEPVIRPHDVIIGGISLGVDSVTVAVGQTVTLVATVSDISGNQLQRLPNGETVDWRSSNVGVATVIDGIVHGVGPGRAIIQARAGGLLAAARVGVVTQ